MHKRQFVISITALLTLVPVGTWAALDAMEAAMELSIDQVQLPFSEVGAFTVRPCADCDPLRLSIDGNTRYFLGSNPEPVSLAELRDAVDALDDGLIFIFHTPDDDVVTRIVLGG